MMCLEDGQGDASFAILIWLATLPQIHDYVMALNCHWEVS